jgi:hypothetical protein
MGEIPGRSMLLPHGLQAGNSRKSYSINSEGSGAKIVHARDLKTHLYSFAYFFCAVQGNQGFTHSVEVLYH